MSRTIRIYTDGSTAENPGPGGWAYVLVARVKGVEHHKVLGGYELQTTNGRMELTAALRAMQHFDSPTRLAIHSDASYVVDSFEKGWIFKWKANNWWKNNSKGKWEEVKNPDLLEEMYQAFAFHCPEGEKLVEFVKVKGHAGDHYNEIAHTEAYRQAMLAKAEAEKAETQTNEDAREAPQKETMVSNPSTTPSVATRQSTDPDPGNEVIEVDSDVPLYPMPEWVVSPPDPPDPPDFRDSGSEVVCYGVYERTSAVAVIGPVVMPVEPSKLPEGGKWQMEAAARKMNKAEDEDRGWKAAEGKKVNSLGGKERYFVGQVFPRIEAENKTDRERVG